jgi:hypothetical protein
MQAKEPSGPDAKNRNQSAKKARSKEPASSMRASEKSSEQTERELLALEKKYWAALKARDSSTAAALSDEPCIVVGPQGVAEIDRATLVGMMENASYELNDFQVEDFCVRPLTEDVVVVAYRVKEELEVGDEPVKIEAFDSSVWVRRDGRWTCGLHTESIAGDPFGRN